MLNRILGFIVALLWLGSMTGLFVRDVWPAWTAREPPAGVSIRTIRQLGANHQAGIFDDRGHRAGTAWTSLLPLAGGVLVHNTTVLNRFVGLPPCRIESKLRFSKDGTLEELELDVYGLPMPVSLRGQNYAPYFPCTLQVGTRRYSFRLNASSAALMGEAIRPFSCLPDLRVGQAWRMRLFDPFSAVLGNRVRLRHVLVRVTRRETIEHLGRQVTCYVVEAPHVVAWVDAGGRVLVQQVEVPLLGKFIVRDEPYQEERRRRAKKRIPAQVSCSGRMSRPEYAAPVRLVQ